MRRVPPSSPPSSSPPSRSDALHLDYEQTTELFRALADIRFKLLTIVPTVTGLAVSLLTGNNVENGIVLAIGIFGIVVILGIIIYELRNSLFYDLSVSRASRLEIMLKFPRFIELRKGPPEPGGIFTERPANKESEKYYHLAQKFLGIPLKHDSGLALVYGASLGGWIFLTTSAAIKAVNSIKNVIITGDAWTTVIPLPVSDPWRITISLILAICAAYLTMRQFARLDNERYIWQFKALDSNGRPEGHMKRVSQYTP